MPKDVLLWAMRSLGVEEWVVHAVPSMYANARSRVRVNGQLSEEFEVNVGVHQGCVFSLEALSHEFRTGVPWDLVIITDTPSRVALTALRNGRQGPSVQA